jgi:hypothetical protein
VSGDEDDLALALALSLATETPQTDKQTEPSSIQTEKEGKKEREEKDESLDYEELRKRLEGVEFMDMVLERESVNGAVSKALSNFYRDLLLFYSSQTSPTTSSHALSSSLSLLRMLTSKLSSLFSRASPAPTPSYPLRSDLSPILTPSLSFSFRDQLSFDRYAVCNVVAGVLNTSKQFIVSSSFQVFWLYSIYLSISIYISCISLHIYREFFFLVMNSSN